MRGKRILADARQYYQKLSFNFKQLNTKPLLFSFFALLGTEDKGKTTHRQPIIHPRRTP